jgi:hypothetical protein
MNIKSRNAISVSGGRKPPDFVYSYRTIDDKLRDTLIKQQLWLSNPLSFNDPFDCNFPIQKDCTAEEATKVVEAMLQIGNFSPEFRKHARIEASQGRIIYPEACAKSWQSAMSATGVACFSATPTNILMWSHYASKHQGVCLGFKHLPRRLDLQPMEYCRTMPSVRIVDMMPRPSLELLKKLLLTKSRDWSYEKEWRFVKGDKQYSSDSDPERAERFYPEELQKVIFGCRVAQERQHEIMLLLKSWPTKILFYQAHLHNSRFAVSIRRLSF